MRAALVERPGAPDVLQVCDLPDPVARPGWVLLRVKAFGLNRSEMFTRQGHSGDAVQVPRVLGIECVGVVEGASDSGLAVGQKVAAVMGDMGRAYDGGYAEYALLPTQQVMPIDTDLPWPTFGAIPETFLTAWGSLVESMGVESGGTLLIRGGSSSVGMATATLAKQMGVTVIATTRQQSKVEALRENGAGHVVIDDGEIADRVRTLCPGGVDYVSEPVGPVTYADSARALRPGGVVSWVGILANVWDEDAIGDLPRGIRTVRYSSHVVTADGYTDTLQEIVRGVESGAYRANVHRVFTLDEIVEAHRCMEANHAVGKLVVVVP
jgi:NADPH:quinone reductase-like Zn-dependent oxidoreductase